MDGTHIAYIIALGMVAAVQPVLYAVKKKHPSMGLSFGLVACIVAATVLASGVLPDIPEWGTITGVSVSVFFALILMYQGSRTGAKVPLNRTGNVTRNNLTNNLTGPF